MQTPPKIFESFGCRLNAYETEAMQKLASQAGFENFVVINSCAVTAEAVRQARQRIRKLKRENPQAKLIVTGCAAQTTAEEFAQMEEVDIVLGNVEKMSPEIWKNIQSPHASKIQMQDIMQSRIPLTHPIDGLLGRARAYVQIQNGCDHRCTFCIIPYGRGNSRSVQSHEAVDMIKNLRDQGFNEIVLTGVDMTSWGQDLDGKPRLGELVQAILRAVPDLPRLRISSVDSVEIDDALIDVVASETRFMPHLHLSLQAGDNLILKRMKRRHSREQAIEFCHNMRALRPDIVYGADIIAGFPTETEDMFENSLKLVKECDLTWLHVFPYSPRPQTPAAKMPQVEKSLIKTRAQRLRALGEAQISARAQSWLGQTLPALIEGKGKARTPHFAEVQLQQDYPIGSIIPITIGKLADGKLYEA